MKKYIGILLAFMLSLFVVNGQSENVSSTLNPWNDSVTVSVKFERVKLSKEESVAQEQINTLLINSAKTTDQLTNSLNKLTTTIEQGIMLSQQTKLDLISSQMGVPPESLKRAFKRNNTFKLVALIPALICIFWAMGSFLFQKGLDVKALLAGTAVVALYSFIGSGILYAVLSLVFNKQYFVVKDLMSALF
jgi:hypothetical protein